MTGFALCIHWSSPNKKAKLEVKKKTSQQALILLVKGEAHNILYHIVDSLHHPLSLYSVYYTLPSLHYDITENYFKYKQTRYFLSEPLHDQLPIYADIPIKVVMHARDFKLHTVQMNAITP